MSIRLNPIIINKNVSKTFEQTIRNNLAKLPENIKSSVKNHNKKYLLTQVMTDAAPWLKGKTPSGWPDGMTWNNCESACNKRKAVFCEKAFAESGAPIKGAVYHETAHLVDKIFKDVAGRQFCETNGFKTAYKKDVAHIFEKYSTNNELKLPSEYLHYFLQGSRPDKVTIRGLQETFAETFTILNNATNGKLYNDFILQNYKNTIKYMDKFMYLFGGKK